MLPLVWHACSPFTPMRRVAPGGILWDIPAGRTVGYHFFSNVYDRGTRNENAGFRNILFLCNTRIARHLNFLRCRESQLCNLSEGLCCVLSVVRYLAPLVCLCSNCNMQLAYNDCRRPFVSNLRGVVVVVSLWCWNIPANDAGILPDTGTNEYRTDTETTAVYRVFSRDKGFHWHYIGIRRHRQQTWWLPKDVVELLFVDASLGACTHASRCQGIHHRQTSDGY